MKIFREEGHTYASANRLLTICLTLFGYLLYASESTEPISDLVSPPDALDTVIVETFTPPVRLELSPPRYPRVNQLKNKEGWVSLAYMIDPNGSPYDITVVSSSDDRLFEREAIRAAEKWKYTPATLDGKIIDAGTTMNITFALRGATGASRFFVSKQKSTLKFIDAGNQEKASEALQRLRDRDRNLYEEAYFYLTEFFYNLKWGTFEQQYQSLKRATYVDGDEVFLPKKIYTTALSRKFFLEVKLNLLARSLKTAASLLKRDIEEQDRQTMLQTVQQIKNLAATETSFSVHGNISANYRFSHWLLKSSFGFEEVEGRLAEIRLHCDEDYVGFAFQKAIKYDVRDGLHNCLVMVIGDPGTKFRLVEY